ncbi:MAG: hypothetical protein ACO2PK_04500, partial [Armatimonadota bacterium]
VVAEGDGASDGCTWEGLSATTKTAGRSAVGKSAGRKTAVRNEWRIVGADPCVCHVVGANGGSP